MAGSDLLAVVLFYGFNVWFLYCILRHMEKRIERLERGHDGEEKS